MNYRSQIVCPFIVLSIFSLFWAWILPASASEEPPTRIPEGYVLYVTQPNGWGDTPETAIVDLRKRILPWYQRTFGDRPGFRIDWDWYALVEVADQREWQADGRVQWYVPRAKEARPGPKRNRHSHLRSK